MKMEKVMIALVLALALLCAASAVAEERALPKEWQSALQSPIDAGYRVQDWTELEPQGYFFAVLQNEQGHNMVKVFRQEGGQWKPYLETDKAVPQGKKLLDVYVLAEGSQHDFNGVELPVHAPVVVIGQANAENQEEAEYDERWVEFALTGDAWLLTCYEDFDACAVRVMDDRLIYFSSWLAGWDYLGTVEGAIQRDLRYMSLSAIPMSVKEARRKLTQAPAIPAGDMTAQSIRFTGGQKYAVYSGPGENYLRGGNGKALVSTNDWIQVFGRENGWILIQYAIEKGHMRFGWIPETALPKGAQVVDARFDFYDNNITPHTLDFPALAYNIYETKDGRYVSIGMLEEKFWQSFLKDLGREDLLPYKRLRRQEAPEAFKELEAEFKKRTYDEWVEFLKDKDICAMPVKTKAEAISYIVDSNTGLMKYLDFPNSGKTLQTRIPIQTSSIPVSLDDAVQSPLLGEHTRSVLADLGYSDEEIDKMAENGAIKVL